MAKGVKKIKESERSNVLENYTSRANNIICIKPNQMVNFVVSEWYEDTTPGDKQRDITWLWQDQKKTTVFKSTVKLANSPFGVTIPNNLCGSYAYYLEASLFGVHDPRKTGLYVYGKCDKKITSSSWSKTRGAIDTSEISYGHNLFITIKTEGVNGDTLSIELYSEKNPQGIKTKNEKCIDGKIVDVKFSTLGYNFFIPGGNTLTSGQNPEPEKFYIKVKDITGEYLANASGNDRILSFSIANKVFQAIIEIPTNTAPLTIDVIPTEEIVRTEGIVTAYFAKEEFSVETSEPAGQHQYIFKTKNENINKDRIANIIKKNVDAQVKADKKYAKLDDIKNLLTQGASYDETASISFNLYKLGAKFIKINSAPLEEELYVVANTFLLDGKEVSIQIKEKEAIVVDADAVVPVLEAKKNGEELTILKATVENGIAKVKVKLRPKADEALATWKEKLAGNKKDDTYNYIVKNAFTVNGDLDAIAASIEKKSNAALAPNHIVKKDDIKSLLNEGVSYTTSNSFQIPKYKKGKTTEMLWLKAECQGENVQYEGEFLKRDGEYFVIGKQCECEERVRAFLRTLRVGEGTGELIKSRDKKTNEIIYIPHDFDKGYTTAFNNNFITDLSDHPRINYGGSSAAGAYQVMPDTWDDLQFIKKKAQYNIDSFSKENQDKFSVLLMKHHPGCSDLLTLLLNGQIENSIRGRASRIWASLPEKGDNSRYLFKGEPQPVTPMKTVLEHYAKFLKEELEGESPLYLKKGFLNDFNIKCNCGNEFGAISDWHDPIDNPEITLYNYYGTYNPAGSSFGKVRNGGTKNHQGLDIFAPSGTPVKACLDGTIVIAEYDGNWGNLIVIEVNKEDLDNAKRNYTLEYAGEIEKGTNYSSSNQRFLRYAHLSEMSVTVNQKVTAGQVIGKSGKTGNAEDQNVRARHLHFDIANIKDAGKGTRERENPAFYVRLLPANDEKQKNNKE